MRLRLTLLTLLALAVLALVLAPRPTTPANVVVVAIDTVRADRLGAWGGPRDTTPRLDAFAAEGLRFDQAYAPATWTLPSVVSYLTGLPPHVHGLDAWGDVVGPGLPWLPSSLKDAGWTTVGIVGNGGLNRAAGFARGFDVFSESWTEPRLQAKGLPNYPSASAMTDHAVRALDALAGAGPFFLYVHYMDPHSPYLLPEDADDPFAPADYAGFMETRLEAARAVMGERPGRITAHFWSRIEETEADRARLRDLYDAKLRYVDGQVGRLFDALEQRGLAEDTWVIVLSDHGEGLHDHGIVEHAAVPWEHQIRVPLAVRGPGLAPAVIDAPVELVDLPAALTTALGVEPLAPGGNRSLLQALQGATPEPRPIIAEMPTLNARAIRIGDLKLIDVGGRPQVFDLAADPGERAPTAASPEAVQRLAATLAERFAGEQAPAPGSVELDPEQLEALRALGYVPE